MGVAVNWLVVETVVWYCPSRRRRYRAGRTGAGMGISAAALRMLSSPSVMPVTGSWIGVAPCWSQVLI